MIKEVLLVHHTHTDIGYTHPQPVVFELHDRFIEMALDLADASADERDDARFRWTCEVTGITRAWWDRASSTDRDRFLAAVKRGQFEVAALEWHLTPLADLRMLARSLENVRFFRDLGVPVRSGMNTDVNGVPWGLVDVLLDHGIDGFSMAINSHLGGPVTPRPGAFRWASPSGERELLVWNGFQYWHMANVVMRMPSSVEAVAEAMPPMLAEATRRGYNLPFLPLQITNPHHPDNATPDATLSQFVRDWNDRDPEVRIRTVLLTEVFDRLREVELPVLSGDWTDYWNLGAGSSARETTVLMDGLRVLDAAHGAAAWTEPERREKDHLDAAHANLALYAEHTWGADCSISSPESVETRMQWSMKSAYAYEGLAHARIVLRDALHRLALQAGGEEPTLLLYNPLSVPLRIPVRLPVDGLDWPLTPGLHHRQRLDGALGNLPLEATRWCDVELPALGYRTYPVSALPLASSDGLSATEEGLSSSRVQLEFHPEGGVRSLRVDGRDFAAPGFGVPVFERPADGSRREIMGLDFNQFEPADGWVRDWERVTSTGELIESGPGEVPGAVEYRQKFRIENGDGVTVVYRLFANDPTVDVEATLDSVGDPTPYSLGLPFNLPDTGEKTWHFDTAGALVEFDREQLPNAARHYVTTRRFVRLQTAEAALSIATPDLPLWKFGAMEVAHSMHLDASRRESSLIAWLANNYWEVNFHANQTGRTVYRFRLMPHTPESVADSYLRALPYAVPPRLHAYRELGPVLRTEDSWLSIEGDGVVLESVVRQEGGVLLTLANVREEKVTVTLSHPTWSGLAWAGLDGTKGEPIVGEPGKWQIELPARAVRAVLSIR
jgi:hypothetical protein